MKRRAILLPTLGNPWLLETWLRNYDTWRQEDDALLVCIGRPVPEDVSWVMHDSIARRDGFVFHAHPARSYDHGQALDGMIGAVVERYTLLMEDDVYVREPWLLHDCMAKIESGRWDILGVERGSGSEGLIELMEAMGRRALWPHLLYSETETLQSVGEAWGARIWQKGEPVQGLWHVAEDEWRSDTAVAATLELQLKRRLLRMQTHSPAANLHGTFHVGSLSSGPFPLLDEDVAAQVRAEPDQWKRRIAWWQRCMGVGDLGLPELYSRYLEQLDVLAEAAGDLHWWEHRYNELVNW